MFIGGVGDGSSHGAHSHDPIDADLPPLGSVCAMGTGEGSAAMEIPADEGTRLLEAVEMSYEEHAASLSSNKGAPPFILLEQVFVYMLA